MSKTSKVETHYIPLGKILGPWGLKGEVKFKLYNPLSEAMFETRRVFLKAGFLFREVALASVKRHGKFLRVHLEGIKSPDQARPFQGEEIYIPASNLPTREDAEFYAFELKGLDVFSTGGDFLGRVEDVVSYGASDILVVRDQDGRKERMIPLISDFLRTISLEEKKIVIEGAEEFV